MQARNRDTETRKVSQLSSIEITIQKIMGKSLPPHTLAAIVFYRLTSIKGIEINKEDEFQVYLVVGSTTRLVRTCESRDFVT